MKERLEAIAREAGISPVEQIWEWSVARFALEVHEARQHQLRPLRCAVCGGRLTLSGEPHQCNTGGVYGRGFGNGESEVA